MYTGSFAASLKGIACTRGLSFYSRACQQAYSSFHRWRFSNSFAFTGLYMLRFRLIGECQSVSPTAGKQRFDSVTQHNDSSRIAWKNSPYDNLPPLFPALDEMSFRLFLISKSNGKSSRVHDTERSSLVARRVHSPKVGGSNPSSVSISDLPWMEQIVALDTRQVRA